MDTIDNQVGAVERQWTRDVNTDYNRNYVDDYGNDDDDDDDRRGGSFEMAAGEGTTTIATARQALRRRRHQGQRRWWRRLPSRDDHPPLDSDGSGRCALPPAS